MQKGNEILRLSTSPIRMAKKVFFNGLNVLFVVELKNGKTFDIEP